MGHSYSSFGVLPSSTDGWQLDPCILYGSTRGNFSRSTRVEKLLATAGSGQRLPIPAFGVLNAGTQGRDSCIALRIPQEIWQMVAANMSAAEWARASCTSRALSRMQLETLCLAPPCTAAFRWAAAHWRGAKLITLTIRGWDNEEIEQLCELLDEAATPALFSVFDTMRQVRHMALHLEAGGSSSSSSSSGSGGSGGSGGNGGGGGGFFTLWGMLGAFKTPRLGSLCVVCDGMVLLCRKPLPTLKHLRLEVKYQGLLFYMMHRLDQHFKQLETLTICSDIYKEYQRCSELDLAGMKNLRCVSLQMVIPSGLKVPPGCQVHFVCHNIYGASMVWGKGLGVACTSCRFVELSSFEQAARRPSLLKYLEHVVQSSCPNLTVLKLSCWAVSSGEEFLVISKSLPALRELEICVVKSLHLRIGAELSLEYLTVCSKDSLHFEMEDLDCLLFHLKHFKYAFGRSCIMTQMLVWQLGHIRKWTSVENTDGSTEMREAGALEYSGVALETGGCRNHTCGTCIDCLRRKHLPVSDNVEWPFVGLFGKSHQKR